MNTEEAIEFLENGIDVSVKKTGIQLEKEYLTKMNGVYTLLKRGERYEKMWKEYRKTIARAINNLRPIR